MPDMNTAAAAPRIAPIIPPNVSPLMICDRLIGLAQDADRAGYAHTAGRLVLLASQIFDEKRAPD